MVKWATLTSHRRPPTPQHADTDTDDETVLRIKKRRAEYSQTSDVAEQNENIIEAITKLPNRLQTSNTIQKFLHTQVPTSGGDKDRFNEYKHLHHKHLRPFSNRLTEEAKLQYFQSFLREEAIEFL